MTTVNPEPIKSFLEKHTIAELAYHSNCSVQLLTRLKTGKYRARLRSATIAGLCRALKVKEEELFLTSEDKQAAPGSH